MPKVDANAISYKNNITDFIDYNAIKEEMGLLNDTFKTIEDSVITTLNTEINEGGLDLYSTNINGVPIYHNKAVDIQQRLNKICSDCTEIISEVDTSAKEHRRKELSEYVTALQNRINTVKEKIEELNADMEELKDQRAAKEISINEYQRKMDATRVEKNKYEDELDGGWLSAHNGGLEAKLIEAQNFLDEVEG